MAESKFTAKGRCRVSGKRPYRTKIMALISNAHKPKMARAYLCRHCGRWHLTRKIQ